MKKLLQDLSHLSGLRDRQAMEFDLVRLVIQSHLWRFQTVRLVRAVGPPDDQRWVTLGKLSQGQTQPERDPFWFDASTLPRLANYAQREEAIMTESTVRFGRSPCTTIFPIDTQASVCSLLEVESENAVSTDTEALVDSVLHLFENLQGLLDYGERDTLTELLNRKTFDGAFLRAAQVQGTTLAPSQPDRRLPQAQASYWLAVIDIDHFKQVNGTYGHLTGDGVLLWLARQMRVNFRICDQLYRFGDDEFVVLMRCTQHGNVSAVLERFRHQIEQHDFPQVGHMTVSIGFAPLRENDTPSCAFDRANKAVCHAKTHGCNQTCSFTALVASGDLQDQDDGSEEIEYF